MKKYVICRLFVAFFCTMFSLFSTAQTSLTRQQVCENIDSMVSLIEQVHPDPYARLSKKSFYKEVKKTKKRLPKGEISELRAYMEMSRLAALFEQGHIWINIEESLLKPDAKRFPYFSLFHVEPETHRLILKYDTILGGIALKKGDEMLNINGLESRKLVEKALQYINGERDFFRCQLLEKYGDLTDWLYLNMPEDIYHVKMNTRDGQKTLSLKALNEEEIQKLSVQDSPQKQTYREPYSYEMKNDSVMVFHFNKCVQEGFQEFKEFISKMFSRARSENVHHLIIDNRYNSGGDSNVCDEICRYLTNRPFCACNKVVIRFSEPVRKEYREKAEKYLREHPQDTIDAEDLKILAYPDTIFTHVESLENYCQPYADSLRYTGKIYLLNSHYTYSSASWLAAIFKHYKIGTLIGEETGGMNITSGDIIYMNLPHPKFKLALPTKIYYFIGTDDNSPVHGILPDIPVPAEEAMDAAFKLIEGK